MNDTTELHYPEEQNPDHHAHTGPILGILVIILVLILGGLYLWGGMLAEETEQQEQSLVNNEPETPRATVDQQILETVSSSDELEAIEADLMSTNFDSLDTDFNTIDAELGSVQAN